MLLGAPVRSSIPARSPVHNRPAERSRLGNARVLLQIDVGFGDAVVADPMNIEVPVLLDPPEPRLKGYRLLTPRSPVCRP